MTPEPTLVESGGGFPIGFALIFVIVGIIGISIWLAWMWFKYRNKGSTDVVQVPSSAAAVVPEEHYLVTASLTKTGEWDIRVKGQRYRTLEAVPDDRTRKEVVRALKELAGFARGYLKKAQSAAAQGRPAAPTAAPAAPVPEEPSGPLAPPLSMPPLSGAPAPSTPAASSPPRAAQPAAPAPSKPAATPRLRLSNEPELRRPTAPAMFMPTLDLASEVTDILVEMQAQHPELAGRSIKLRSTSGGSIEFTVDGFVYGNLDEIPDVSIRTLIQQAIQEWERR